MKRWLFRLASAALFFAALYHLAAIAVPAFGAAAYTPGYPLWRHLLFIAINTILGGLLLARPPWLLWPFGLLTLWTFYSHGWVAWRLGGVTPIDVISMIGCALVLGLLISDRAEAATRPATRKGDARP